MEGRFNFTIIIPHKNIPKLLERCLKSIPKRDDLEVIIVDDKSDSNIVDYEHFPGKERENTTIIYNNEEHGGGYARNCALPIIKGNWVLFADADDFFLPGFNEFLNEYQNSNADVVYFNANSINLETSEPSNRADNLQKIITCYHEDVEEGEKKLRFLFTEPWCKMVKRHVIDDNKITFNETIIRNDVRYSYLVGYYANKLLVDPRQLYCVTSRNRSISKQIGIREAIDELKVYLEWKQFYLNHNISVKIPLVDQRLALMTSHIITDFKLFKQEWHVMRMMNYSRISIMRNTLRTMLSIIHDKIMRINK